MLHNPVIDKSEIHQCHSNFTSTFLLVSDSLSILFSRQISQLDKFFHVTASYAFLSYWNYRYPGKNAEGMGCRGIIRDGFSSSVFGEADVFLFLVCENTVVGEANRVEFLSETPLP